MVLYKIQIESCEGLMIFNPTCECELVWEKGHGVGWRPFSAPPVRPPYTAGMKILSEVTACEFYKWCDKGSSIPKNVPSFAKLDTYTYMFHCKEVT